MSTQRRAPDASNTNTERLESTSTARSARNPRPGSSSGHYGDVSDGTGLRAHPREKVRPAGGIQPRRAVARPWSPSTSRSTPADVVATGTLRLLRGAARLCRGLRLGVPVLPGRIVRECSAHYPPPQNEATCPSTRAARTLPARSRRHLAYRRERYREAYGLFVANGILFNHESPRRGEIASSRARSSARRPASSSACRRSSTSVTLRREARLGVRRRLRRGAMWRMLQVRGAGRLRRRDGPVPASVRDFVEAAFGHIGCRVEGPRVEVDLRYFRPPEVGISTCTATAQRPARSSAGRRR